MHQFRESLLLIDPATSTQAEQQNIADVVAHELAHMWFGDLVTMRWWNGIWLNEAFATFMELAACDAYRPEWGRWTLFGLERSAAFETDSLRSTRPVEYEVRSPHDCEGMLDVLTYQKGGALLRMLEQYLGEDRFRAGVSHYLRSHAYSNTETNDLWDAIEETAGNPVRRMMDSWIWQPGYPLVSASLDGDQLVLRQQRFAYDDATLEADESPTTWLVPVHVRNGATTTTVLLDSVETPALSWPIPPGPWSSTRGATASSTSATTRSCAAGSPARCSDRWTRWSATTSSTMRGTRSWPGGWPGGLPGLRRRVRRRGRAGRVASDRDRPARSRRLVDDADLPALQARIRTLLAPAVTRLGEPVDGEGDLRAKLRGLLTAALAIQGADESTRERAAEAYRRNEETPGSVDPELVAAATSIVASTADQATFEQLVDGFRNGATPQDQLRHLFALAEVDAEELLLRACEFAMGGEVKTQNAPFLLRMCIANRAHGAAAWQFVRQRWDEANTRFPSNTIVRMVDSVKLLTEPEVAADVQAFFAEHPIEQAAKTLDQILERQRVNVALRARERDRLAEALSGAT